jgi:NTP pyrophosphatase (non-canonical NTP hydrolase)
MELAAFQDLMDRIYGEQDRTRGRAATVAWLAEEIGELAQAVRKGSRAAQVHELGDVLAWVASLANQLDIGWDEAVARYTAGPGCPVCHALPCACPT